MRRDASPRADGIELAPFPNAGSNKGCHSDNGVALRPINEIFYALVPRLFAWALYEYRMDKGF